MSAMTRADDFTLTPEIGERESDTVVRDAAAPVPAPSPIGFLLRKATREALQLFQDHLPKGAFSIPEGDTSQSDRETKWVDTWAHALIGVSLVAIPDAARRWLGDEEKLDSKDRTMIPQPASFAKYARKVDYDYHRLATPQLALIAGYDRAPHTTVLVGRVGELGARARKELGSMRLASEVWEVLLQNAGTESETRAIREGRVSDADFDCAIRMVRERHAAPPQTTLALDEVAS